jgi:hypothetical protein
VALDYLKYRLPLWPPPNSKWELHIFDARAHPPTAEVADAQGKLPRELATVAGCSVEAWGVLWEGAAKWSEAEKDGRLYYHNSETKEST